MSYEIVKNIRVEKNTDNEFYHVVCTSASNNVRPLYYEEYTFGINNNWTKEEAEKYLLLQFYYGNFQRGSSRYNKTVKEFGKYADRALLNRHYRINKVYTKVRDRAWKVKDYKNPTHREQQISSLCDKLRQMDEAEIMSVLHKYMIDNIATVKARSVEPFVIIEKYSGLYVAKVTNTRYFTTSKKIIHTSKSIYNRVTSSKWWTDNFIVEGVSQVLS